MHLNKYTLFCTTLAILLLAACDSSPAMDASKQATTAPLDKNGGKKPLLAPWLRLACPILRVLPGSILPKNYN